MHRLVNNVESSTDKDRSIPHTDNDSEYRNTYLHDRYSPEYYSISECKYTYDGMLVLLTMDH
jgi:hypothetical protein